MKNVFKFLAIAFGAIAIDQITKGALLYLVSNQIPLAAPAWEIVPQPWIIARITSFFNIVFTWNPGTSFSLFRSLGEAAPIVIIIMTGVIIGFIGYYALRRAKSFEKLPLALILGGAIGNLIDRIRFGAVIDFLDFHIGRISWPAFNVADICICVGIGLYVLNLILAQYRTSDKGGK